MRLSRCQGSVETIVPAIFLSWEIREAQGRGSGGGGLQTPGAERAAIRPCHQSLGQSFALILRNLSSCLSRRGKSRLLPANP